MILAEEDAFQRLNSTDGDDFHVFDGSDVAFYKWRIMFTESHRDEDPILPSSVMLGLRNNYGGYQRWMKFNRRNKDNEQGSIDAQMNKRLSMRDKNSNPALIRNT